MTSTDMHAQSNKPAAEKAAGKHVVLFDGVCGLCSAFNNFLIDHDKGDKFMFAPLQSSFAGAALSKYGKDPSHLETVYVVENFGTDRERVREKADAALFAFAQLGGWPALSGVLRVLPTPVLRWGYDRVAAVRYRLFGKFDTCRLPDAAMRSKFIELE